jgi:hypothetical protein
VAFALGIVQGGGDEYAFYFVGFVRRLWVSLRTPTFIVVRWGSYLTPTYALRARNTQDFENFQGLVLENWFD